MGFFFHIHLSGIPTGVCWLLYLMPCSSNYCNYCNWKAELCDILCLNFFPPHLGNIILYYRSIVSVFPAFRVVPTPLPVTIVHFEPRCKIIQPSGGKQVQWVKPSYYLSLCLCTFERSYWPFYKACSLLFREDETCDVIISGNKISPKQVLWGLYSMLTCNSTRSETSLLLTSVKKLKLRKKRANYNSNI